MTNGDLSSWARKRHRCGIQVEIVRESEIIARATIGGLITVGDEVYGLTVGHIFSPSTTDDGEEQHVLSSDTVAAMKAWQEGKSCGMEFDWALVKLPGLQLQDVETWENVNLVKTVSGEFRPVLVGLQEPSPYTQVVLATPGSTHCLRGVLLGSGAILNIPGSPTPYDTWVCRMELPWLIQSGDSGSWVLDAENGMLLGVLVAGCPELQEAYIIPAHEILNDIKRHYQKDQDEPDISVCLLNCHPLPRRKQIDLFWYINEYRSILKSFKELESVEEVENLICRTTKWANKAESFTDIPASAYNLRDERSPWKPAQSVLKYELLTEETYHGFRGPIVNSFEGMLKAAIQQPPLRCYNLINERILIHQDTQYIHFVIRLWRCLMLCLNSYSRNDKDIPEATKDSFNLTVKREFRLMTYKTSDDYPGLPSPWDNGFMETVDSKHRVTFSLHTRKHLRDGSQTPPHQQKAARLTGLPAWDRLTATGLLDRLRGDLQDFISIQKSRFEVSLPEAQISCKFNFI
ncbi:hypothetical protein SNK03_010765 [Fusarium graminearum]